MDRSKDQAIEHSEGYRLGGSQISIRDRIGLAVSNLSTGVRVLLAGFRLGTNYCLNGNRYSDNIPHIQRIDVKKLPDQI